jgi:hypothetical protein
VQESTSGNTYTYSIYGLDGTSGPALKVSWTSGSNHVFITGTPTFSAAGQSYPLFLSLKFRDQTKHNFNFSFGYSPQEIESAYDFGNVGNGAGQTIVILESGRIPNLVSSTDPNFANSDLNQFDQIFPGLNTFNQPGGPVFLKVNTTGSIYQSPVGPGDVTEEVQDIEWAHALAPMANIVDINANALSTGSLYTNPKAFLQSLGLPTQSYYVIGTSGVGGFSSSQPTGVTYIDSSGDNLGRPAASAGNIVLTGYTQLTQSPTSSGGVTRTSEAAVFGVYDPFRGSTGAGTYLGSGGGDPYPSSTPESYQSGIYDYLTSTVSGRFGPDVSFNGSPESGDIEFNSAINSFTVDSKAPGGPNLDFGGGPWEDAWGTSISSPSWDSLLAIANQGRAALGKASLSGATQTLPMLYALANSSAFNQISTSTAGNLAPSNIPGQVTAVGKTYSSDGNGIYNTLAGLGTPVVDKLIPYLIGPSLTRNTSLLSAAYPAFTITGLDFQSDATYQISFSDGVTGTVIYQSPTTLLVTELSGLSSLATGTPLLATVTMTVPVDPKNPSAATFTDTTGTPVQVATVLQPALAAGAVIVVPPETGLPPMLFPGGLPLPAGTQTAPNLIGLPPLEPFVRAAENLAVALARAFLRGHPGAGISVSDITLPAYFQVSVGLVSGANSAAYVVTETFQGVQVQYAEVNGPAIETIVAQQNSFSATVKGLPLANLLAAVPPLPAASTPLEKQAIAQALGFDQSYPGAWITLFEGVTSSGANFNLGLVSGKRSFFNELEETAGSIRIFTQQV